MVIVDEYINFIFLFWRYVFWEVRWGKFEKVFNLMGKMEREEKINLFFLIIIIFLFMF